MKIILVDAFNTFVIKDYGIFQDMYEMLEGYPNKKIILTNANEEQMQILGLVNSPYEMFTLKHEPEKTDPKYFQIMLEHFGLSIGDVIYFEHNEDAVKSVESIGIKTFHYDKDKKDLVELKKFIDENIYA